MKRTFSAIFWWLALTIVVTAAIIVSIAREMAPKASEYKPEVEVYFSELLSLDIAMEEFELLWPGLAPELQLKGVVVRAEGREDPVVQIDRFILQIDLLSSLWNGALSARRGEVDGLEMSLQQHDDGRWFRTQPGSNSVADSPTQTVMETLLRSSSLILRDSRFNLITREGDSVPVDIEFADLKSFGQRHSVEARASYGDISDPVSFSSNFIGTPWDPIFQGDAYIDLRGQILNEEIAHLAAAEDFPITLSDNLELDAEWWLKWDSVNNLYTQGLFRLNYLPLPDSLNMFDVYDVRFRTDFRWREQTQSSGWFRDIEFILNDELVSIDELRVEAQLTGEGRHITFGTPYVSLEALQAQLMRLPEGTLRSVFEDLSPTGALEDFRLKLPLSDPADFTLNADLVDVSAGAWGGAPAVASLNGSVVTGAYEGVVTIGGGPFSMHFPSIYERAFNFAEATGTVHWAVNPEAGSVLVGSSDLKMAGSIGDMTGAFYLDGVMGEALTAKRDSQLILQIGLDRSSVIYHRDLVPFVVSDGLREWLDDALVLGDLNEGDFLMRLDLSEDCDQCLGLQLTLDTQNVELKYQSDWPSINGIKGTVYLDNEALTANIEPLSYLGFNVLPNTVAFQAGESPLLTVGVTADGSLHNLNAHLITTPLWPSLEPILGRWQMDGFADSELVITSPLDGEQLDYELLMYLDEISLSDQPLSLNLEHLAGEVLIRNDHIRSEGLVGEFWGHPAQIEILRNNSQVSVDFSGVMTSEQLVAWTDMPVDSLMQGSTPFSGRYEMDANTFAQQLKIESSLLGMSVDLPSRWSKAAAQVVDTTIEIPIRDDGFDAQLNYGELLSFSASVVDGELTQSRVHFGEQMPLSIGADVWVSANLERVDVQRYIDWFDRKTAELTTMSDSELMRESGLSFGGEVKTAALRINDDLMFHDARARVLTRDDGTFVEMQSTEALGTLLVPFEASAWIVNLERLAIPELNVSEGALAENESPFRITELSELPELQLTIGALEYGGEAYGSWSLDFEASDHGVRLNNIQGEWNGLEIRAPDDATESLWVAWREHPEVGNVTSVNLASTTADFNAMRQLMGWDLPVTAQSGHLNLRGSWEGTPLDFKLGEAAVDVDFELARGQLQTSSAGSDLVRLFNLFNFNTWARRLKLDFDDLQRGGIAFDTMSGRFILDSGHLDMMEPVVLDAPSSRFVMTGQANLTDSTVDANLNVTVPVGNNVAWITAIAVSLPAAAGVFLASQLFEEQFDQLSTLSYKIEGSLDEPDVTFERFFAEDQAKQD